MKNPINRLSSRGGFYLVIGGVLFMLTMSAIFAQTMQTQNANAVAERNSLGQSKDSDITRLIKVIDEQNDLLRAAGKSPVPVPPVAPPATPIQQAAPPVQQPIPGKDGRDGRDGQDAPPPTIEQVGKAIDQYCAARLECRGKDGKPGKDGRNVTPEQAAEAIAEFCGANGECQGKDGTDGKDGRDGAAASDEQVAAGVAAYCAGGVCRGDDGSDGKDGKDGKDGLPGEDGKDGNDGEPGRGIAADGVKCVDGTWQITYSDGDVDLDAGSCAP